MGIANYLSRVEPFSFLNDALMAWLASAVTIEQYLPGDAIVRRGGPGDCMYVIAHGVVEIPILQDDGSEHFRAQLPADHCFGEMAVLTGAPRNADVIAKEECTCVRIPRATVLELIGRSNAVAAFLTEMVGDRLIESGGPKLVGKYQLIRPLGRGGMSIVFEGRHPMLDRPVAVKMLSHALVHRRNFAERFSNEARIIAALRHPSIVEVFDLEEAYATIFIVMELLEGQDLSQVLERRELPIDEVRSILVRVAEALEYAHERGVVHRDVKPSNVQIDSAGGVKLMDFGLAKVPALEARLYEEEDIVLGTPYYMSPEQARGVHLDLRTDIYNLGLLAFEMLTGERPYSGKTKSEVQRKHVEASVPVPSDYARDVPADLEAFVVRCLQKHPADRFQSCTEVIDYLLGSSQDGERHVRTLRLVYPPHLQRKVDGLVAKWSKQASRVSDLELETE